jgi:DNA-binding MarR family transcriptional regulator
MSQQASAPVLEVSLWPRQVKRGPCSRVRAASKAIRRELAFQLSRHGIAEAHYSYLRALLDRDGMTITEISERLGIEPATVTGMVDRFTFLGLVKRERHPSDRRKIQVFLTPKGAQLREPLIEAIRATHAVIMTGLSEQDREGLMRMLDAIVSNVDQHLSEQPAPVVG